MSFEAHITFPIRDEETVKRLALTGSWKFSKIHGDPVLGDKAFCYLTNYDPADYPALKTALGVEVERAKSYGAEVLRTKIEEILLDQRSPG